MNRAVAGAEGLPALTALIDSSPLRRRRGRSGVRQGTFSRGPSRFTDPRLCSAIMDRVTFNTHIIQTGIDSYRLEQTRDKR
ncbi:ATP-binding protein [Streptomyces sp. NPDC005181]|uniref:ATP-binding protein n=1 Tax=Streptomyces sp. NPDC005181 TaxID=3156869 RepID=UPI0033B466B0